MITNFPGSKVNFPNNKLVKRNMQSHLKPGKVPPEVKKIQHTQLLEKDSKEYQTKFILINVKFRSNLRNCSASFAEIGCAGIQGIFISVDFFLSIPSTQRPNKYYTIMNIIERFSNDCRKTKTKVITPTNHDRGKQRDETITIPSNYLKLAQSAGKITRTWCDWFWFCFSLAEKLAQVF